MIQPLDDRVLVKRLPENSFITLTDAPKGLKGVVLAVGPGKRHPKTGKRLPCCVKPGDKIIFNSKWNDLSAGEHVGTGADLAGPLERPLPIGADPLVHLIREADIFGIVPNFDQRIEIMPDRVQTEYFRNTEIAGPWSDPANAH
jgi:co-chaperonin GroES (HSP10)